MKTQLSIANFPQDIKGVINGGKLFSIRFMNGKRMEQHLCQIRDQDIAWKDKGKLRAVSQTVGNQNIVIPLNRITYVKTNGIVWDFVIHNYLNSHGNLDISAIELLKPNQHAVVTRLRFKSDAIRYLTSLGYSIDTTSRLVDIHITNGCRVLREGYNPGRPNDNYAARIQRQFTDKKKRK